MTLKYAPVRQLYYEGESPSRYSHLGSNLPPDARPINRQNKALLRELYNTHTGEAWVAKHEREAFWEMERYYDNQTGAFKHRPTGRMICGATHEAPYKPR